MICVRKAWESKGITNPEQKDSTKQYLLYRAVVS